MQLNKQIKTIWDNFSINEDDGEIKKTFSNFLSPIFLPSDLSPNNCKLLVIGLNPSYSVDGWKKVFSNSPTGQLVNTLHLQASKELIKAATTKTSKFEQLLNDYFDFDNWSTEKQQDIDILENAAYNSHDYFKKMRSLAEYIYEGENHDCSTGEKAPWYHIDLFYFRVTNQNTLKKYIKTYPCFFKKQLVITRKLIQWLNPDFILIANAYAGEVFREMFYPIANLNLEQEFNNQTLSDDIANAIEAKLSQRELENYRNGRAIYFQNHNKLKEAYFLCFQKKFFSNSNGTYELPIHGKTINVFFSGMLSGQRALDLGSFERLKWHMKAVKEEKEMK